MFERYTQQARRAVFRARHEASQCGSTVIETEHLLVGILREDQELTRHLLLSTANIDTIQQRVRKAFEGRKPTSTSVDLPFSASGRRCLTYAAQEAEGLKHAHVGADHLLLGISREESSTAAGILREYGLGPDRLRLESIQRAAPPVVEKGAAAAPAAIRNLVEEARTEETGPLVGRERELERIIHILSRRTRNHVVLIGDAGVGKTAIVEGLAQRMAEGNVPSSLQNRRLLALDASSLLAGRPGALHGGADDVLSLVRDPDNTILFVRGLFNLPSAGSAWAVVEAMHALEPQLALTRMQSIATGSLAGFRAALEKAGMLARRFEAVPVAAVSEKDAIEIVSSLKVKFERFHGVTFGEGAIETAVYASGPFLPGRALPDRAIDLMDEAAVAVRLRKELEPPEMAEIRKRIRRHAREMENAIGRHEFDVARHHSDEQQKEQENLEWLQNQPKPPEVAQGSVTPADILAAVAMRVGAPLAAVERVFQSARASEFQQWSRELAALPSAEPREWLPFLCAYLARCPEAEAEALARAILAGKPKGSQAE